MVPVVLYPTADERTGSPSEQVLVLVGARRENEHWFGNSPAVTRC